MPRGGQPCPADVVLAVKGGRFITHMKALRDVETPLANFFASGVLALGAAARAGALAAARNVWPSTGSGWRGSSSCCPRSTSDAARLADRPRRQARRGPGADDVRGRRAGAPRPRAAARELRLRRGPRALCRARRGARRRRQRRPLAGHARRDERLPLRAAARRERALRERLHRRVPRPVGRHVPGLARRGARRPRLLRQRREGSRAATTRCASSGGSGCPRSREPGGARARRRPARHATTRHTVSGRESSDDGSQP